LSCAQGHADVVKGLLKAGANVDVQDSRLSTPIHVAVRHGHADVVKALLLAGVSYCCYSSPSFVSSHHIVFESTSRVLHTKWDGRTGEGVRKERETFVFITDRGWRVLIRCFPQFVQDAI
jgi:ankyrin repeat protein